MEEEKQARIIDICKALSQVLMILRNTRDILGESVSENGRNWTKIAAYEAVMEIPEIQRFLDGGMEE